VHFTYCSTTTIITSQNNSPLTQNRTSFIKINAISLRTKEEKGGANEEEQGRRE
jgi:hypothetical protein